MDATLPLLGLVPPSDRWGIRGFEPKTAQKPRVGLHCPPHMCRAQAVIHAGTRKHMHSSSVQMHRHEEQALAWPDGSSCDCLPLTSPPPPPSAILGKTSIFVNPGIMSLCFPRAFPEARGTEEPAPGLGEVGAGAFSLPGSRTVAGHSLLSSAREHLAGSCSLDTGWHCPAKPSLCVAHQLTNLLGMWPRQVSGAGRTIIAPSGQVSKGTPLGLTQGQG